MGEGQLVGFRRREGEAAKRFGERLRELAAGVAADPRARCAVLLVDDGAVGAPAAAASMPASFDAALLVSGIPALELPAGAFALAVERRVMKARARGRNGERSPGFTLVCPVLRAAQLSHAQFDAHWRDAHGPIHIASSPGTCHYEQLSARRAAGGATSAWDGVGLLSFASAEDWTQGLFGGPEGRRAIYEDIPRFLRLDRGETLPASEFVFRDDA